MHAGSRLPRSKRWPKAVIIYYLLLYYFKIALKRFYLVHPRRFERLAFSFGGKRSIRAELWVRAQTTMRDFWGLVNNRI